MSEADRTCRDCRHIKMLVALGLGVKCSHPGNEQPDGKLFSIPTLKHTCEHFDRRENPPR